MKTSLVALISLLIAVPSFAGTTCSNASQTLKYDFGISGNGAAIYSWRLQLNGQSMSGNGPTPSSFIFSEEKELNENGPVFTERISGDFKTEQTAVHFDDYVICETRANPVTCPACSNTVHPR